MDEELKKEHDELLARIPDGVAHDTENCLFCTPGEPVVANDENSNGGDMSTKTYTEEELKAAIAEALAPLQAELDTIKQTASEQEVAERIAEAVATVESEKADLQTALDAATVEAEAAKAAHADLVAYLEAETAAAAEAAAFEATKEQRLAEVAEVASFTDEYLQANADRWARMDEDAFAAQVSDWKEIAAAAKTPAGSKQEETKIPATTAMVASRQDQGTDRFANIRKIMRGSVAGNDPRTV